MNTQDHTREQIEACARSAIVLAQGSGTPLWMARQIFDSAFDEMANASDIESVGEVA